MLHSRRLHIPPKTRASVPLITSSGRKPSSPLLVSVIYASTRRMRTNTARASRLVAYCLPIQKTIRIQKCRRLRIALPEVAGKDPQTGADILTSNVVWEEAVDITADQALAAATPTKDKGQQSGAVGFLLDVLANGPVPVKIIDERAVARGFSKDQLKRAKQKMCVGAFKEAGKARRWLVLGASGAYPTTDGPWLTQPSNHFQPPPSLLPIYSMG